MIRDGSPCCQSSSATHVGQLSSVFSYIGGHKQQGYVWLSHDLYYQIGLNREGASMAESPRMVDGMKMLDYKKFRKQRELGRGTFGAVHLAHCYDPNMSNPVVMKEILGHLDDKTRKVFFKEARLLSGLRHANVVRMHGICEFPLIIIMEYVVFDFKPFLNRKCQVNTVDKFLLEVSKLRTNKEQFDYLIPAIANDAAKGLSYLHQQNIVHRDLKPMNILISNQHYCYLEDAQEIERLKSVIPVVCKLADFVLSRSQLLQTNKVSDPSTVSGWKGTLSFIAPEIVEPVPLPKKKLSLEDIKRIDIWALGLVFYCLVNPSVSYPYERDSVYTYEDLIFVHRQGKRPSGDPRYQFKQDTVWSCVNAAHQACVKHDPTERPNAFQVLNVLQIHCAPHRHDMVTKMSLMENDDVGIDLPEIQISEQLSVSRVELRTAFRQWIPVRVHTMERLEELATKLHNNHRNVKISTITGASIGTVGGVLAVAGLVMAPFTFGAGLAVSAVGAGIGGAGGLVMSGSKGVEILLEKIGLKDVQQAIEEDFKACKQLQKQIDSLESFIYELAASLRLHHDDAISLRDLEGSGLEFLFARIFLDDKGASTEETVDFGFRFFRVVSSAATISASTVATMARSVAIAGTRAAHIAGSAIGAALLPLDIALLVKSSLELHRGSTSTAVEEIRRILSEMKCPGEEEIESLIERFIVEKFNDAFSKMKCDT